MVEFVCAFILFFGFLFFSLFKKKNILNPIYLFILILLSSYFVYSLKLSGMQSDYGIKSVLFILFIILALLFANSIKIKSHNKKEALIDRKRYKFLTYFLFIVVTFCYLLTWYKLGAPPLFSKADRTNYFVSGIGSIYLLVQSLSFLIMYDWFKEKCLGFFSNILFIFILFMIVSLSNKFQLFCIICEYIILYNQMKKKIKMRTFIILAIVAIMIFIIYYNYIYDGMYISLDLLYEISNMKIPKYLSFITTPYLYVSFNYDNLFHYMFDLNNNLGYGYFSFKSILESLKLNQFLFSDTSSLDLIWKNSLQYSWLTTGTIFRELYMDFSYVGCFVGVFIIGLISKKSYKDINDSPNLFNSYFYTVNIISLFLLFFTNNFISVNYYTNLFCIFTIYSLCLKRGGGVDE